MTDRLLEKINANFPLMEKEVGEFSTLKANGMKFTVKAYEAKGLGHVSVMIAKGFFGLMKMDTLMIVPKEKDLPLYSYDRIYAMGNDTLIVELYDTLTTQVDLSKLDDVLEKFANLPERDPGKHWYDSIKLSQSISKKGKKEESRQFDDLTLQHFDAYLSVPLNNAPNMDKKKELSLNYVNGLLENGGPSTDVFKKSLGKDTTEKLFKKVLFGVE
ncbi:MAG: hypothetical protein IJ981_01280 [Clostridia bacterium]|nr:hypothetical protein [Clostridia bacterium]